MKLPGLDLLDVSAQLRAACKAAGGQRAWAAAHGISEGYLSDAITARREPGPAILAALGLRKVVRFVPVQAPKPEPDQYRVQDMSA